MASLQQWAATIGEWRQSSRREKIGLAASAVGLLALVLLAVAHEIGSFAGAVKFVAFYSVWCVVVGAIGYAMNATSKQLRRDIRPLRGDRHKTMFDLLFAIVIIVGVSLMFEVTRFLSEHW